MKVNANKRGSMKHPDTKLGGAGPVLSSLLGPAVPSFRALSGRLQSTVRRHKFNKKISLCRTRRPPTPWASRCRVFLSTLGLPSPTQNPKPETRNPRPETRNPKPETRNLKPETRNPNPETRIPNPESRNPKPPSRNGWTRRPRRTRSRTPRPRLK